MNLNLKSIKLNKTLSEETPAYTATLYVNGKKAATLANHGHGGPDMVQWTDKALEAAVASYFASLPPINCHGMDLPQDLEIWAHGKIWDQDLIKTVRQTKRVTGITVEGIELGWRVLVKDFTPRMRLSIVEKHKGIRFFHEMSDEDIVALTKA